MLPYMAGPQAEGAGLGYQGPSTTVLPTMHQPIHVSQPLLLPTPPAPTPTPAHAPAVVPSAAARYIRLPDFDGTQDVDGFFVMFELGCKEMGMQDESKKACLVGRLKGAAAAWAQGLGERLYEMFYQDIKAAMKLHF